MFGNISYISGLDYYILRSLVGDVKIKSLASGDNATVLLFLPPLDDKGSSLMVTSLPDKDKIKCKIGVRNDGYSRYLIELAVYFFRLQGVLCNTLNTQMRRMYLHGQTNTFPIPKPLFNILATLKSPMLFSYVAQCSQQRAYVSCSYASRT